MDTWWFYGDWAQFPAQQERSTAYVATASVVTAIILGLSYIIITSRTAAEGPTPKAITEGPATVTSSVNSFRISGIPSETTAKELEEILENLEVDYQLPGSKKVVALTLSASNISSDASRYQTAVVTFSAVPKAIRPCLSPANTVTIDLGKSALRSESTVESNFFGLTPLNSAPSPTVE